MTGRTDPLGRSVGPETVGRSRPGDGALGADERGSESGRSGHDPWTAPTAGASANRCPYCGRPFRGARYRALHVGDAHSERWTAAQRDAYEDARDAESDALFVLQLKLLAALVALYFGLFVAYAAVWTA
jgi:hypothetical protein